jgi:3-methyladenine DNA glycosylase AlkC
VIKRIADIGPILLEGRTKPTTALSKLRALAASDAWQTREVAATALVEIAKRHPHEVLAVANRWARNRNPFLRRAASEGLRGLVQTDPESVRPILEELRGDPDRYIQKSIANVLRNASRKQATFVVALCAEWARSGDPATQWTVKQGLRKLEMSGHPGVARILTGLAPSA